LGVHRGDGTRKSKRGGNQRFLGKSARHLNLGADFTLSTTRDGMFVIPWHRRRAGLPGGAAADFSHRPRDFAHDSTLHNLPPGAASATSQQESPPRITPIVDERRRARVAQCE